MNRHKYKQTAVAQNTPQATNEMHAIVSLKIFPRPIVDAISANQNAPFRFIDGQSVETY